MTKLIYHYLDGPFEGNSHPELMHRHPQQVTRRRMYSVEKGAHYINYHKQRAFKCGSVTHILYSTKPLEGNTNPDA